jgi:hypothetical protein
VYTNLQPFFDGGAPDVDGISLSLSLSADLFPAAKNREQSYALVPCHSILHLDNFTVRQMLVYCGGAVMQP